MFISGVRSLTTRGGVQGVLSRVVWYRRGLGTSEGKDPDLGHPMLSWQSMPPRVVDYEQCFENYFGLNSW